MEMWPVSSNIAIAPPEIITLPGRPAKNRKKEVGETKKSGKLPRTELEMTCSMCHVRGHNKRGCPHRAPSAKAEPTAPLVATTTGSGRGRGKPKKTPTEATTAAPQEKNNGSGRGRGRLKKISSEAITEPLQEKKKRETQKNNFSRRYCNSATYNTSSTYYISSILFCTS
ncbi:hypothetical protein P3S68_031219 [Capsicum galapagoense]